MPCRLRKLISLGISSLKILISSLVISQRLVNLKKGLGINLLKTLIKEDKGGKEGKVDNLGKVDRTGVGKVVKDKIKIKAKVGPVIIMALMDKDGQEIMDQVTKAGVAIMEDCNNQEINGKEERTSP